MKRSSLGCITPLGLLSMFIILLGIGGISLARGGVLFSSGPLNAQTGSVLGGVSSHAGLSSQCESCHPAPWSSDRMSDRCLECHTTIRAEFADPSSLHGILQNDQPEMDCRACHTEHNGPAASLTFVKITNFPHELVGYSLAAHTTFSDEPLLCEDCHLEKLTVFRQEICADCHISLEPEIEEQHFTVFGLNCLACHDGVDTYGTSFDHASTGFDLQGAHFDAPCQGCHPDATTLDMLAAISQRCYDCHRADDVHKGNLGADCEVCHTAESWQAVHFDHSDTGYLLVGQHSRVECIACHPNQRYAATPVTCQGCHIKDDPHEARFGIDCELCHTPLSWQEATFDHTLVDTTDCIECHLADAPVGHYPGQCSTCHTTTAWIPAFFDHDAAGAIDCQSCHARPEGHYPGQCSACHSTDAWIPAFFDHAAAGAVDCQACHTRPANHYNGQCSACHTTSSWAFVHSTGTDCQSCHTSPAGHYAGQCSSCHTINSWAFVHSAGTDCQSCHTRPSGHPSGQCSQCHNTSNWDDADGGDEGGEEDD